MEPIKAAYIKLVAQAKETNNLRDLLRSNAKGTNFERTSQVDSSRDKEAEVDLLVDDLDGKVESTDDDKTE